MKYLLPSTLLVVILLIRCGSSTVTSGTGEDQTSSVAASDTTSLQQLVRRLYEWHETKSTQIDFEPVADANNEKYIGINADQQSRRLTELKQTGLFSEEFFDNYTHIANALDSALKNKEMEWLVGDIPPFGNDLNPWCNCQDNPDNYWKTLTIHDVVINQDNAEFIWTWGEDFEYYVRAIRQGGDWKIAYLEGFNFDKYIQ